MERYSIGIYRNGSLVSAYISEPMDYESIDEHLAAVRAQNPDCRVDAAEHDESLIQAHDFIEDHIDRACTFGSDYRSDEPR